jgi:hypothetical protein
MEIIYLIIGLILFLWAGVVLHIASERLESANMEPFAAKEALQKALEERSDTQVPFDSDHRYNAKGKIV